MKKGHLIFAQNSSTDYIRQAYALALSIKRLNKINSVCLITNDPVPFYYTKAFDYIIPIPWGDMSRNSTWKIENRWKLIYATPFTENLVYDADMLLLNNNDHLWHYCEQKDLMLTTKVYNYKGIPITNSFYRKMFIANNLPDIYFGLHYFKKSKTAFEFYKWLELIVKNYKQFYEKYAPMNKQDFCSLDVSAALALQFMDYHSNNDILTFTHMKPQIQNWVNFDDNSWQKNVIVNFTKNLELFVANWKQAGLFHYTEDSFLTDSIINFLENKNG